MKKYFPNDIEAKWQEKWDKDHLYDFSFAAPGELYYDLVELPYPSGDLHLGHWFAFVPPDAYARFKRMTGSNVLFPMGFDAFGLPAENAAMKRDVHPKDWTFSNIETMTKQFQTMGTMLAWNQEVITCEPKYYRWNQWIFLKMFEKGLAYRGKALSNWCPVDQTVLANENIEAGKCWRCGTEVIQKEIEQWFLKITDYADKLIWPKDSKVDWPTSVRVGQNNWIGKSDGVLLEFNLEDSSDKIEVFTTALDTVFGVSFMVISPEHPLVQKLDKNPEEVKEYIKNAQKKSELERTSLDKEKTGVFTGSYCLNPFNGQKVPVWIADYVIMSYGTGAVMGVPGHDERDHEFAAKFGLPIIPVIKPANAQDKAQIKEDGFWSYTQIKTEFKDKSALYSSGEFDGLTSLEAKKKMEEQIEAKGFGKKISQYHLHDWSISRQRYWGTPVPIIHCDDCGAVPVPDDQLPVELPYDVDFKPQGKPPLASNEDWLNVKCPKCGKDAKRDAETLDTFFDSSWYFFRYLNPDYSDGPFDKALAQKALPVDVYFGGAEHTLGHTLYARFFTKFFKDLGLVEFDEFALKRVQHGVVLGPDGNRMSKSKGNVVNPDELVKEYGADTVRLYLSFMMPYIETTAPFNPGAIAGIYRFLRRIWDLSDKVTDSKISDEAKVEMNKTIKKVTDDLSEIKFNTAVAAMMEWLNYLSPKKEISNEEYTNLVKLLAPFAPHITEELWNLMGNQKSVHLESWPKLDENYLKNSTTDLAIQVNGKVRDVLRVNTSDIDNDNQIQELALKNPKVAKFLDGKTPRKIIYVKGKIISIVI